MGNYSKKGMPRTTTVVPLRVLGNSEWVVGKEQSIQAAEEKRWTASYIGVVTSRRANICVLDIYANSSLVITQFEMLSAID